MEKRLIIVEINKLLNGDNPRYKIELYEDFITDRYIQVHQLIYHIGLSGGTFIVKLNYDRGAFNHTFEQEYLNGLTSADLKEQLDAATYFDKIIDPSKMIDLFKKF